MLKNDPFSKVIRGFIRKPIETGDLVYNSHLNKIFFALKTTKNGQEKLNLYEPKAQDKKRWDVVYAFSFRDGYEFITYVPSNQPEGGTWKIQKI